jgi:hypothetical protein
VPDDGLVAEIKGPPTYGYRWVHAISGVGHWPLGRKPGHDNAVGKVNKAHLPSIGSMH